MSVRKMTEVEFAKEVGASAATVGRLRRDGLIDYHQYGRRVYYLEEDIEAWHEKMKRPAWSQKNLRRAS